MDSDFATRKKLLGEARELARLPQLARERLLMQYRRQDLRAYRILRTCLRELDMEGDHAFGTARPPRKPRPPASDEGFDLPG